MLPETSEYFFLKVMWRIRRFVADEIAVHDDLQTMSKKRKLRWHGHSSIYGIAKTGGSERSKKERKAK